jgi:hypothetical protein
MAGQYDEAVTLLLRRISLMEKTVERLNRRESANSLSGLRDVQFGGMHEGQFIYFSAALGKWINTGPYLDNMVDVEIDNGTLADNQVLTFDTTGNVWRNQTPTGGEGGVTDHGALTGLGDDDHSQYHNDTRGDARYFQKIEFLNVGSGAGDAGKPVITNVLGRVDSSFIGQTGVTQHEAAINHNNLLNTHNLTSDIDHTAISNIGTNSHAAIDTHIADGTIHFTQASIDHGSITGLGDDDHSQYLLLAGRSGGQVAYGGTAASNVFKLGSTTNATKGSIRLLDQVILSRDGDASHNLSVHGSNAKVTTAALEYLIAAASANSVAGAPLMVRIGIKTDSTAGSRYGAIEVDDNSTKRALVLQPSGGNVGIGAVAPGNLLTVAGNTDGYVQGIFSTNLGSGTAVAASILSGITGSGNIEIGGLGPSTTAWAGYGAVGNAFVRSGASATAFNIISPGASAHMRFFAGTNADGAVRMLIQANNGRILVNSTTDDTLGILQVTGVLTVNSAAAVINGLRLVEASGINYIQSGNATRTSSSWIPLHFSPYGSASGTKMVIDASGNVGIGTAAPTDPLHINKNAGTVAGSNLGGATNTLMRLTQVDSTQNNLLMQTFGGSSGNFIIGSRSSGTGASPTATAAGQTMIGLEGYGHDGTNYQSGAAIRLFADSLWSVSNRASRIEFIVTPTGSTTPGIAATLSQAGYLGIGITSASRHLHVRGAGQATSALTDAGNTGGTLYLQDSGSAVNNGGAILFGASQGYFAAIKSVISNGTPNTVGHLAFSLRATTGATALTEMMRIQTNGILSVPAGINFGATTLSDYDEGFFTPTMRGSTTPGTASYGTRHGNWTRIGNMVFWEIRCSITNKGGMVGSIYLGTVPFTPLNQTASTVSTWLNLVTASHVLYAHAISGGTNAAHIYLYTGATATASSTTLTNTAIADNFSVYTSGSFRIY